MTPTLIVYVLAAHWVADFVLQTDKMALNKSTSNAWLLSHVSTYTLAMLAFCLPVLGLGAGMFVLANGLAHAATDYGTSRWTSRLWKAQRRHAFFVVIGLDQLAHAAVLVYSLDYFR